MSCSICGCSSGCNCSIPTGCPTCECVDKGSLTAGRHAVVLDYKLCEKRLVNSAGFLVNNITGSGTGNVVWSSAPCVELPQLVISEGVQIDALIAPLGDSSCWHAIVPDPASTGVLMAQDGKWILGSVADAPIPDPLTIQNVIVEDTATINDVTINGSACFTNIVEGTVTQTIGLNDEGCIVKSDGSAGTPLGISVALYYENASETSVATPNLGIVNNGYAQIGNEIVDSNGIAQVQAVDQLKILTAGQYEIEWMGNYNAASQRTVNLNLEINGGTPIPGNGSGYTHSGAGNEVTYPITGMTVRTFAANDTIKLICESSVATANNLVKVKVKLTRFGA